MSLGSVPMGLTAALITYFPARYLVKGYQQRRHQRRRFARHRVEQAAVAGEVRGDDKEMQG
jgi:uncharacterized protein (DUF2062 family)